MVTLDLIPHSGAGPILLGSLRAEVREVLSTLGFPLEDSRGSLDYFCESSIQIEYSPEGHVWFIGLSCHQRYTVQYKGKDVFALEAPEIFALIAASETFKLHAYNSYEYCFPDQIITLWDADEQYDRIGNASKPVWAQVGVGDQCYVEAISALRGEI